jgi:tetratricopeptide (TPR) repeat protein
MLPRALIPARLSVWSWKAFLKALLIVLAIGACGGFVVGGGIALAMGGFFPSGGVVGLIVGPLLSLFFGSDPLRRAGRKPAYDRAIAEYTEAIARDPNNATAYFRRAQVYRILAGQYAWPQMTRRVCLKAIADYDEAIRLAPTAPAPYVARVNAFGAMGQLDRAIADYTEAIRLDPTNALAYCARAVAYNALFKFDRAIPDATEAIRLAPHLYAGHDARGYALWHRGNTTGQTADYVQAVADFTESIRLEPESMDGYYGRAQVYRTLGNFVQAARDDAKVREVLGR